MKQWSDWSLQGHAGWAIAMLVLGMVGALVLSAAGQPDAAVSVAVVFAGATVGILIRLRQRLVPSGRDA